MNFAFTDEQEELRRTVRKFLESRSPMSEERFLLFRNSLFTVARRKGEGRVSLTQQGQMLQSLSMNLSFSP